MPDKFSKCEKKIEENKIKGKKRKTNNIKEEERKKSLMKTFISQLSFWKQNRYTTVRQVSLISKDIISKS